MLIDFHTHTFPDKIAEKTITLLNQKIKDHFGYYLNPLTDGTVGCLDSVMDSQGVDLSVILPIATKATQTETIINASAQIRNSRLISFATIHPDNDNKAETLQRIKEMGFVGIKIHPDYQDSFIDSKENLEILQICEKLGLYTVIHAGIDGGFPPPHHALPERIKNTLEYISGEYLIAAHLGGFLSWDDVEKYLVGTTIYFDTSMTAGYIEPEQMRRIIVNHGSDKILFGSDCPWNSPSEILQLLESLSLPEADLDNIKYRNGAEILGIALDNIRP